MTISKILLIDDDEVHHIVTLASIQLQDSSVEVTHAYNAQEGLMMLEKGLRPDIILLDLKMPGMNGFEFLEEYIARDLDKFPVVMLSSSYSKNDRDRAFRFKCVPDYICKPFSTDDLERISVYTKQHTWNKADEIIFQTA